MQLSSTLSVSEYRTAFQMDAQSSLCISLRDYRVAKDNESVKFQIIPTLLSLDKGHINSGHPGFVWCIVMIIFILILSFAALISCFILLANDVACLQNICVESFA